MRTAPALAAALAASLAVGAHPALRRGARAFPPLSDLPSTPFSLQDAALASAGLRACAADLAWIELLQYMAGGLPELPDAPGRRYDHLLTLCRRVTRLDPSFHRAYLFGASVLAWFEESQRPDEAVELLREGMRDDPGQPLYPVYLAAMAYRGRGGADKLLALLEPTLGDPRSPIETKAIVANLYKARGEYGRALALWNAILDNPDDAREWPRARVQVADIERLTGERR